MFGDSKKKNSESGMSAPLLSAGSRTKSDFDASTGTGLQQPPLLLRTPSVQRSAAGATVKAKKVNLEYKLPCGTSRDFSDKNGREELLGQIDKQSQEEKTCDIQVGAELEIVGSAEEVVAAAHAASFDFQQYLAMYHSTKAGAQSGLAAVGHEGQRELSKQFHADMSLAIGRDALVRRESMALLADFSSVETLLEQGVEGYIEAVRRVLRTGMDEAVEVSFRDLSYTARAPKISQASGFETVSSKLRTLTCGLCRLTGRAIKNGLNGRNPIEWEEKPILRNLTGVIKPGRLTLVLSPPGAGKTSFLRAIAGRTSGHGNPGTITTGDLRYNQRQVSELKNLAAWVSYVSQSDDHQTLLTVRETLQFAFNSRKKAFYESDEALDAVRIQSGEAAVNRVKALKEVEVDITLALLGLTGCADTIIGNANIKGVSGGEKRRVTLGEMLVTGSQVMCCDEISTGLDSAATFDIVAYLGSAAHALRKSLVVALLQPPPEVIDLFDDILLLAEGRIIYHGPRDQVLAYFEGLGFAKAESKDLGDFLVELPTRNGIEMQLSPSTLQEKGLSPPPVTADEFADRWESSEMFFAEVKDLDRLQSMVAPRTFDFDKMPVRSYVRGLIDTLSWCMALRLRDRIQIVARVLANAIVGFFFGTLFWQLGLDDWWLKAMLFVMSLIFLASTAFPMVQIISQQRPVFYKHIEAKFYSPSQFAFAQWIVAVPFVCFDVFCFGSTVYWMCGLAQLASSYATFLAVSISFGIAMSTLMSLFPFVTPNEETGIVVAALYLIISVVASGALSTESMIPVLFRWMMWINPLAWSYRALAINEYHTPAYDTGKWCHFNLVGVDITIPANCQDYFLDVREVRSEHWYVAASVCVNLLFAALCLGIMTWALARLRFESTKLGAVPDDRAMAAQGKGAIAANEARRNYEHDKYLNAVSPRAMHDLATGSIPLSPMVGESNGASLLTSGGTPSSITSQGLSMLHTPPKTLLIRDLWYTIPINGEPIDFLKGVSFCAKPGRMCALMGSSGAGKTTLMDCIAGRKTVGYARGEILVNGEQKVQQHFVKYIGYVEQFGVHADCATIKESLEFSAQLRLPSGTRRETIQAYVRSVLELLELDEIENALAGSLSMEQNKRLTLGVELVANPSIVFCDEPTSGLDARAAAIVMRVLLKVARSGRTVVATIHQPSRVIFNFFDDLLLLKRGGEMVYFGELGHQSRKLVDYLEAVPGTSACPPGYNPATWMLEAIGAGTCANGAAQQKDYAAIYNHSNLRNTNLATIDALVDEFRANAEALTSRGRSESSFQVRGQGITSPLASPYYHANADRSDGYTNLDNKSESKQVEKVYVRGQLTQTIMLLRRNLQTYWRSPEFSLNRLLVVMLFTTIFACFFFRSELHNVADLQGRVINIFFFSSLTAMYNLYTLVPFALSRRALYYRERSANMYSVWAFNMAEGLVELPWIFVQTVFTVPLIYFVTNLNTYDEEPFFYFMLMIMLLLCLMSSMALFSASVFPDALAAQLASVALLICLMCFCGILVPKQNLPTAYLPMYFLSFFKYSSEMLLSTQFHDIPDIVCLPGGKPVHFGGPLPAIVQHYFPKINISDAICTNSGHFDLNPLHVIDSIKDVSGVQMGAEDFVMNKFARDYDYDNRWIDIGVILGWIVALRLVTFVTMVFVNHLRR